MIQKLLLSTLTLLAVGVSIGRAPLTHAAEPKPGLRVGAAAVDLKCDETMVLAGMLDARFSKEQEGQLRAVAVVVERPGAVVAKVRPDTSKLAIVGCDVLWVPRDLVDSALDEIERTTGIHPKDVLINASHTHHAPSPAPAHNFGVSSEFRAELRNGIVRAVQLANKRLNDGACDGYFWLGEENTVGANSRLRLPNRNITWINPLKEATDSGGKIEPTGPFDPQLPVLDFRNAAGRSLAVIFNHSTHTIGTKSDRNVRSPSFYGLAAQELESEIGAAVAFLEGASGSTHNVYRVPVAECIVRMKKAIQDARAKATRLDVQRLASIRRPLHFKVRQFDDAEEDAKVLRYTTRYTPQQSDFIRGIFATMRRQLMPHRGEERVTWVQAMCIGDVAVVGAPAEYFTALGIDIKRRSPFRHTIVAELANDWIGYLPTRQGHADGGYQTWTGLHSYAEIGTGERVADAIVEMLDELAGKRAGRPDLKDAVKGPQSPAEEKVSFRLADPKLEIELVAAEPDVVSPVAMAWDADGRLYVVEMFGYPQTEKSCRVVRLEDRDGDGHYEKRTVFADGLSFPTSVCPSGNGILVAAAPDILYLEDTNGDGKANVRRVVWTGFNSGSQQLRANALHFGIDNWIYGANGRCDGVVHRPNDSVNAAISIRASDFRWHPKSGAFEAIVGQSQFGQVHDDWGNRFLSWNTVPIRHALIESRYLKYAPELAADAVIDLTPGNDTREIFTIAPPPQQFNSEKSNFYNAMCGLTIFRGATLGQDYVGDAFIGESLSSVVTRRKLRPDGPSFAAARPEVSCEFLACKDGWFHPVYATTGPDGALYIADFYRQFVEHPIYVASEAFRSKVNWRNGAGHGRIWRVRRADFGKTRTSLQQPAPARLLSKAPSIELVALLEHAGGWQRDTAQRLLVERGDKSVAAELEKLATTSKSPQARLHALYALDGIAALQGETLVRLLSDADARVRRQSVVLAEQQMGGNAKIRAVVLRLANDPDSAVRFQVALTLRSLSIEDRLPKLAELLTVNQPDRWITLAATVAGSDAPHELATLLEKRDGAWLAAPSDARFALLVQLGKSIAHVVAPESQKSFLATLESTHPAWDNPGTLALFGGWIAGCTERGRRPRDAWAGAEASTIAKSAAKLAVEDKGAPLRRMVAVGCLVLCEPAQLADCIRKLRESSSAELLAMLANALADRDDPSICRFAYDDWQHARPGYRRAILAAAKRSAAGREALVEALEQNRVAATELPLDVDAALGDARRCGPDLARRFAKFAKARQSPDRAKVCESYLPALTLSGNVQSGAAVFRENCLACHSISGTGNRVGPDLAGVAGRAKQDLLIDILDPSRRLSPDFVGYMAVTKSGQILTGLVVSDTPQAVTLRQERGVETTIRRVDLEELKASNKSLMPDGHEKKIDRQRMADLLEFLRQPDRNLLVESPAAP